jgi:hypothetical protein
MRECSFILAEAQETEAKIHRMIRSSKCKNYLVVCLQDYLGYRYHSGSGADRPRTNADK